MRSQLAEIDVDDVEPETPTSAPELAGSPWRPLLRRELARASLELGLARRRGVEDLSALFDVGAQDWKGSLTCPFLFVDDPSVASHWRRLPEVADGLRGVACSSAAAQASLINAGISLPTVIVHPGVDHLDRVSASPRFTTPGRRFRFLHVSPEPDDSGLDLLLAAFDRVFDAGDDVSLVVAPGSPESAVRLAAQVLRNPGAADVILLKAELTPPQLKSACLACDIYVAPARVGGFDMALAQALLCGAPAIATARGGHMSYCDAESTWLLPPEYRRDSPAQGNRIVAEPRARDLEAALWTAFTSSPGVRRRRAEAGRRALSALTWRRTAEGLLDLGARELRGGHGSSKVGWVTTWNVRCGIGAYAEHLNATVPSERFMVLAASQEPRVRPDEVNVVRAWRTGKSQNGVLQLSKRLSREDTAAVIFQFNYGFFDHAELAAALRTLNSKGIVTLLDLHSTRDPYGDVPGYRLRDLHDVLPQCDRVIIHSVSDFERMGVLGVVDNLVLLPLGVLARKRRAGRRAARARPLITSFGYCFDTKGLLQLVEAMAILRDRDVYLDLKMLNAEYDNDHSREIVRNIRGRILELGLSKNIDFRPEYLDDDEALDLISEADLFVNPYQRTNESASAAVRFGLAAGVPVAVTPLSFFDDLHDAVFRMPGITPHDLADGIEAVLSELGGETAAARRVQAAADAWRTEHDYELLSTRLTGIIDALVLAKSAHN